MFFCPLGKPFRHVSSDICGQVQPINIQLSMYDSGCRSVGLPLGCGGYSHSDVQVCRAATTSHAYVVGLICNGRKSPTVWTGKCLRTNASFARFLLGAVVAESDVYRCKQCTNEFHLTCTQKTVGDLQPLHLRGFFCFCCHDSGALLGQV